MPQTKTIQILLATHNGSVYLQEFMESLLSQDCQDWSLLISDDCSTDTTPELLQKWVVSFRDRVSVLPRTGTKVGAVGNFSRLLAASTASYVMFADQDDVWLPNKIGVTYNAMRQIESESGTTKPILVHTDLEMVDKDLKTIAKSHWKHQGLVPERGHSLSNVMMENVVWGCTSMLNRCLVNKIGAFPEFVKCHDWWCALVAAAFGEIVSLPMQTIKWRRHDANDSQTTNLSAVIRRAVTGLPQMSRRLSALINENCIRNSMFLKRYRSSLNTEQIAAIETFLVLPFVGFWRGRWLIVRHRLFFTSLSRTIGLLLLFFPQSIPDYPCGTDA